MEKRTNSFVILVVLMIISAACQTHQVAVDRQKDRSEDVVSALKALDEERVESVAVDYIVDCKVRLKTEEEANSGNCQITLTHDFRFLLTVLHPLGGLILKIYADDAILQVKDYRQKSFRQYALSKKNRLNIPLLKDFSLLELQSVLWGRALESLAAKLDYELDERQRLKRVTKSLQNGPLVVEYNRWLSYQGREYPRILSMRNEADGSSIKLAVTNFQPGFVNGLKLDKQFTRNRVVQTGN